MITGINLYPKSVPDNPSILPFSSKRQFEVQVEISFFDIFIVVKENTADYCECHFRFKLFLARKKITIVDFTRVFITNRKESVFGQPEGFHVSFFFFLIIYQGGQVASCSKVADFGSEMKITGRSDFCG